MQLYPSVLASVVADTDKSQLQVLECQDSKTLKI